MPNRTLAQRCAEHEDCTVIQHIEELATITVTDEEYDADGHLVRTTERTITIPNFVAWWSHAHVLTHVGCRLGDATPEAEDHTAVPPGELAAAPGVLTWRPTCASCHAALGHPAPRPHPPGGGVLLSADGSVEVHSGEGADDCAVCAPRAAACEGCRATSA